MSVGAAIAGGVIAGVGNLAGAGLQHQQQKQLLDYNAALNLEQWRRETAYNDPSSQMARLRAAGLNPDLAIGGNVANTAGHADLTAGTPSAPHLAGLGSSVMSSALSASQVELNDAAAAKNIAEADKAKAETEGQNITNSSLDEVIRTRLMLACKQAGLTEAETQLKIGQLEEVQANAMYLAALVPKARAETRLLDSQRRSELFKGDLLKYDAGVRYKELQRFDEMFTARLQELFSQTKANNAYASYTMQQYRLIKDCWDNLVSQSEEQVGLLRDQRKYTQDLANFMATQYQWFPVLNIDAYMRYMSVVQLDADGKDKYQKQTNGSFPALKEFSRSWDNAMHYVNGAMGVLSDMSTIYRNIGVGTAAFKGGYINLEPSKPTGPVAPDASPSTRLQELERWLEDPRNAHSDKWGERYSEYWRIRNGKIK